jgi:drug/metabolite transporter (DMT)-like permease
MTTVILGLLTALSYALQDYLMMPVARAASVIAGVLWIRVVAVLAVAAVAVIAGDWPSGGEEWRAAGFAALGGVCEVAAFLAWLTALSRGQLSVVSPLGSISSAFTVVFVLIIGQSVSSAVWVALPLAVVGGALTSLEPADDGGRSRSAAAGAGWAVLAAAVFGVVTILFGEAAALAPITVALFAGLATVLVTMPLAVALRAWRLPARFRRRAGACGLMDAGALIAFAAATAIGPLSVVGIIVAQTGTMAVLLGMVLLGERPSRTQMLGIVLTLAAVTLLGAVS